MVMIALDTETYKWNEKEKCYEPTFDPSCFSLGCIIVDRLKKPKFFYNADEMFNWLVKFVEQKKKEGHKVYIYAHNHRFDFYRYARNFMKRTDLFQIRTYKPLLGILNEKGYLLDTGSFYKMSLEKVGKLVGLPKLEMPEKITDLKQLEPYCQRDTEIVMKAMTDLKENMSKLGYKPKRFLTAGQLALTCFRTWCRRKSYYDPVSKRGGAYSSYLFSDRNMHLKNNGNSKLIRRAYRGARNECFKQGVFKNVTMIDINSLYPYAMANMPIPDPSSEQKITGLEYFSVDEIINKIGVVEATIEFPKKELGYLAFRDHKRRSLYSAVGNTVCGWWTTLEIKRAIEEGYKVKELHNAVVYKPLPFNPFKEFMETLYELRRSMTREQGYVIKLIMNNLYGKFAQNTASPEYCYCPRMEVKVYESQGYVVEEEFGEEYLMIRHKEKQQPKYAIPIISILVTAYGRNELYNYLKKIPFEDIIYTDTDSIAFKGNHLDKFPIGEEMGEFKVEVENVIGKFSKEKWYKLVSQDDQVIKQACAGNPNKEMSDEQLFGKEQIVISKMHGYKHGLNTNNFKNVGQIYTQPIVVNTQLTKRNIKVPPYYKEFSEEDLISQDEIGKTSN